MQSYRIRIGKNPICSTKEGYLEAIDDEFLHPYVICVQIHIHNPKELKDCLEIFWIKDAV